MKNSIVMMFFFFIIRQISPIFLFPVSKVNFNWAQWFPIQSFNDYIHALESELMKDFEPIIS